MGKIIRAVAIVLSSYLTFAGALLGQSPKEALNPKTIKMLEGLYDPKEAEKVAILKDLRAHQDRIEGEHQAILAQQQMMLEELKVLMETRQQVVTNTEDLRMTMQTLKDHIESQRMDPENYAVLKTEMNAILWTCRAIGGIILGWILKQILGHLARRLPFSHD